MLDRVFSNLIENAARHGKSVSQVVITYQIRDDGLLIYVEDDGVGIPDPEKERIFEYSADGGAGSGSSSWEILSITGMTIAETGTPGEGRGSRSTSRRADTGSCEVEPCSERCSSRPTSPGPQ